MWVFSSVTCRRSLLAEPSRYLRMYDQLITSVVKLLEIQEVGKKTESKIHTEPHVQHFIRRTTDEILFNNKTRQSRTFFSLALLY